MPTFVKAWKYTGEDGVFASGNSNSLTMLGPLTIIGSGNMSFAGSDTAVSGPLTVLGGANNAFEGFNQSAPAPLQVRGS